MSSYKRIRVFIDRDLRATRLEMAVIDTETMQRLRFVRQLGQSFVAFPTADHSRFSHSLGALYWSAKMLVYLRENYFSNRRTPHRSPSNGNPPVVPIDDPRAHGNVRVLADAETALRATVLADEPDHESLGLHITCFEQLVRLSALIHDITHLPYGHTLEDQAELLPRHDEDPARILAIFSQLKAEIATSPHLRGDEGRAGQSVLNKLLDQCAAMYYLGLVMKHDEEVLRKSDWSGLKALIQPAFVQYLTFAYDIVSNTICADLIDYLHRDSLNCGMPWSMDKILLSHLTALPLESSTSEYPGTFWRCGVAAGRSKLRHDVITAVLGLLRARYDLTEKVYYHHTKCAADAILEAAIRRSGIQLSWTDLYALGDEGTINYFQQKSEPRSPTRMLLGSLRSRRFHKAVYRIRKAPDWDRVTKDEVKECTTATGRTTLEANICRELHLPVHAVVVSCLPWNMQLKIAKALIEWTDGEILTLDKLPTEKQYLPEVTDLTERYKELWSLTVYLDEEYDQYVGAVMRFCERHFDRKNDALLKSYLRVRHPEAFEIQELYAAITDASEIDTASALNVAKDGGDPSDEAEPKSVALKHLHERVKAQVAPETAAQITLDVAATKRKQRRKADEPSSEPQE